MMRLFQISVSARRITDSAANIKKAFTSLPGFEVESDSDNVDEDESDDCDDTGCADESIFTENHLLEHFCTLHSACGKRWSC